jgi:hypothetical protein
VAKAKPLFFPVREKAGSVGYLRNFVRPDPPFLFNFVTLMHFKPGLRFFLSWIISAVVMFTLFYLWHGVFLNDFKRIQFPLTWFVTFAAFTYLILGAGLFMLYESRLMRKVRNLFTRGVISGIIAGFALFMIATIVHISLTSQLSMKHLLVDCIWQMSEQVIGAMVVVALKLMIHEPQPEHA